MAGQERGRGRGRGLAGGVAGQGLPCRALQVTAGCHRPLANSWQQLQTKWASCA